MIVYQKMVQACANEGWCEYEDGHLNVKIFYSGEDCYKNKPWVVFSVWGADDTGMEINEYVADDAEANKLIGKMLDIYHDMPKYLSFDWLLDRGFVFV